MGLDLFHPAIRDWFRERLGPPTEIQECAWPRIAAGEHVLVTAPTGSGKTLAAFLWALQQLLTGAWPGGVPRVVYVSPLKALNNDVQRNLLGPLAELQDRVPGAMPVHVLTRSGDTPSDERQRMARQPPEILVTTPESLGILLTSRGGRALLAGVRAVVLDEVHAVAGNKRGAALVTALERLVALSGEFQRIALTATVRPPETVARWIGGACSLDGRDRTVTPVVSRTPKAYDLAVRYPAAAEDAEGVWPPLVEAIRAPLRAGRRALVFANSRRMVEKIARLVNEDGNDDLVFAHHGSLSREVRHVVEERLKQGALAGIVATNSLELGIDVGHLDEILLVQAPPSITSAVQRIGRAGHRVGETSRGTFLPIVPNDLLDAVVAAAAVREGAIEPVEPVVAPLDVLAQSIVAATATMTWRIEDLWNLVRRAAPYRDLPRRQFDLVLAMLAGRHAATRVRELRPVVSIDEVGGTVTGLPGAARLVYQAGGTIPDRGYFHLRRDDTGTPLGELDEEFVWERSVGDAFTLGVQTWRVERITHNDVFVSPSPARQALAPFWRADARDRGALFAERTGSFLAAVERRLDDPELLGELARHHGCDRAAAAALVDYLRRQREACGGVLPHRRRIVVEHARDPGSGDAGWVILHTTWGGRVNRPFALALAAAWEEREGTRLEALHDDGCVVLGLPLGADVSALLGRVRSDTVDELVRRTLSTTGFFGARFREAAGIALLLPRQGFRRRTPLWLSRQKAKDLLDAVRRFDDFPVVLETWRACLRDDLDLGTLRARLDELHDGRIAVATCRTSEPSPFAGHAVWRRTNELMYETDKPPGQARVRADLLREVALAPHLRPRVPREIAATFRRKLQRTYPGYAPRSPEELLAWAVERVAIPHAEWDELLGAMERPEVDASRFVEMNGCIVAAQDAARVRGVLDGRALADGDEDPLAELLADWLRHYPPLPAGAPARLLGLDPARAFAALEELVDGERVVLGQLSEGESGLEVCDAENLERLLRIGRRAARSSFEPRPAGQLGPFLAFWQEIGRPGEDEPGLRRALERLFGFPAPADAWETEILPARLAPYRADRLDALLGETELRWFGCGEERIAFALEGDRELFVDEAMSAPDDLLPPEGRLVFEEIAARAGVPSAEAARRLWAAAWQGSLSAASFAPVRRGIETGFAPAEPERPPAFGGRAHRRAFGRWASSRPFGGAWFRLAPRAPAGDALDEDERARDRARVLIDRYGVLCRDLLARELPPLQWGRVFRALRLMELSGELVAGQFFLGVPGLQFAAPEALRVLEDGLPATRVAWVNATDPASPAGLALDGADLPRRVAGTHLAFVGPHLAVVSERRGARLDVRLDPGDPSLPAALGFLSNALTRPVRPWRAIVVETVNGGPAADSPYRAVLAGFAHVERDGAALRLIRRR